MTPIVLIDPGHPSTTGDKGVVYQGFSEVDWAMDMGLILFRSLEWLPIAVEMTRHGPGPVKLSTRHQLANAKYQADLVISLHANANKDPRVRGMMSFHVLGNDKAAAIGTHIVESYGFPGYYIGSDGRQKPRSVNSVPARKPPHWTYRAHNVLSGYEMPAVLIEAGFATNDGDRARISSREGKNSIAAAIVRGVCFWLENFPSKGLV